MINAARVTADPQSDACKDVWDQAVDCRAAIMLNTFCEMENMLEL